MPIMINLTSHLPDNYFQAKYLETENLAEQVRKPMTELEKELVELGLNVAKKYYDSPFWADPIRPLHLRYLLLGSINFILTPTDLQKTDWNKKVPQVIRLIKQNLDRSYPSPFVRKWIRNLLKQYKPSRVNEDWAYHQRNNLSNVIVNYWYRFRD